jgi:hypothetical protein
MPRKKRGSGWENDRSKAGDKNAHKSKKSKKSCSHCGQAIVVPSVALAKAKKAVAVAASSNGKGAPAVKVMERTVDAQTAAAVERVMNEYKPMVTHESGKSIGLQMGSMLMRIVCGILPGCIDAPSSRQAPKFARAKGRRSSGGGGGGAASLSAASGGSAGMEEEEELKWINMEGVFEKVRVLTGVSTNTTRGLWDSFIGSNGESIVLADDAQRGRGSSNVDKVALRTSLTEAQCAKVDEFIEMRNNSSGKVTTKEIMKYLELGPDPGLTRKVLVFVKNPGKYDTTVGKRKPTAKKNKDSTVKVSSCIPSPCPNTIALTTTDSRLANPAAFEKKVAFVPMDPPLPEEMRCKISRSSLLYYLHHHLDYERVYTKTGGLLKRSGSRHARIRKFVVEMHRARKMEDAGTHVVAFTDETYIHQNHSPLESWVKKERQKRVGRTSAKGKRLIVLHAISRDGFIASKARDGSFIRETALEGDLKTEKTSEWIWPAKGSSKDYHEQMDGDGFMDWLQYRFVPAFDDKYNPNRDADLAYDEAPPQAGTGRRAEKKCILVCDNASYHRQMNTSVYPEGKSPSNVPKGFNIHVLRSFGCSQISIMRGGVQFNYEIPEEPAAWAAYCGDLKAGQSPKAPAVAVEKGTAYANSPNGPSSTELAEFAETWLRKNHPEAVESRVEALFRKRGWCIIWTPPYCPKFQPIELVWGVGKQRAGNLYYPGRTLETTREHLRRGWYGGASHIRGEDFELCDVPGCVRVAYKEMDNWVATDKEHNEGGLVGSVCGELSNISRWTDSADDCLDIQDMEYSEPQLGDGGVDHVNQDAENEEEGNCNGSLDVQSDDEGE